MSWSKAWLLTLVVLAVPGAAADEGGSSCTETDCPERSSEEPAEETAPSKSKEEKEGNKTRESDLVHVSFGLSSAAVETRMMTFTVEANTPLSNYDSGGCSAGLDPRNPRPMVRPALLGVLIVDTSCVHDLVKVP